MFLGLLTDTIARRLGRDLLASAGLSLLYTSMFQGARKYL